MTLDLNNCTIKNNTTDVIRVIPDAPGVAFDISANGGQVNAGDIQFDTIEVSGNDLETNASIVANGLACYFNLENNRYVLSIPDDFAATFE